MMVKVLKPKHCFKMHLKQEQTLQLLLIKEVSMKELWGVFI